MYFKKAIIVKHPVTNLIYKFFTINHIFAQKVNIAEAHQISFKIFLFLCIIMKFSSIKVRFLYGELQIDINIKSVKGCLYSRAII